MNAVVEYELADGIVTITLNRPDDMNAVNLAVCEAMHAALTAFEKDPQAPVAVLTGRGKVFCAEPTSRPSPQGTARRSRGTRPASVASSAFPAPSRSSPRSTATRLPAGWSSSWPAISR
jgi:hypothetical protein